MKTQFLIGMFHITHPTHSWERKAIPKGEFMIDSLSRANDSTVLFNNKPVSANDFAGVKRNPVFERSVGSVFQG